MKFKYLKIYFYLLSCNNVGIFQLYNISILSEENATEANCSIT